MSSPTQKKPDPLGYEQYCSPGLGAEALSAGSCRSLATGECRERKEVPKGLKGRWTRCCGCPPHPPHYPIPPKLCFGRQARNEADKEGPACDPDNISQWSPSIRLH